jgi:hypothetical protein
MTQLPPPNTEISKVCSLDYLICYVSKWASLPDPTYPIFTKWYYFDSEKGWFYLKPVGREYLEANRERLQPLLDEMDQRIDAWAKKAAQECLDTLNF